MSMPYEDRRRVYEAAIRHYGEDNQIKKALEETSELIQALAKLYKAPSSAPLEPLVAALTDELADATIMIEQLRLIFDLNDEVLERIDYKVNRLLKRMLADGLEWEGA